ncbi:MAG: CCA-adding enzyme [Chlamydiia bacterium]|nr:CCA-adding enzyme [Chlamydiia bacterium]
MSHFENGLKIVQALQKAGHTTYIVGGYVRDMLMDAPSYDIDIGTTASCDEIEEVLEPLIDKVIPVGRQFGILIVVIGTEQFEVATFRQEGGYENGRHPTMVEPAPPEMDALRRDFTINGMFYDPLTKEIHDFVDGRADIQAEIVRAIGDADERFNEDRLRMLRAVRYATRFGFAIENRTKEAIVKHAPELMSAVSVERIYTEFDKMSEAPHFQRALVMLHQLKLLGEIFPELKEVSIEEIQHRTRFVDAMTTAPLMVRLMVLFPNTSLEKKHAICDFLKAPKREKEMITKLEEMGALGDDRMKWIVFCAQDECDKIVDHYLHFLPTEQKEPFEKKYRLFKKGNCWAIDRVRRKDPVVMAKHFLDLGIPAGKKLGELLRVAEEVAFTNDLRQPGEVIEYMRLNALLNLDDH